jgi:hypothetical protein
LTRPRTIDLDLLPSTMHRRSAAIGLFSLCLSTVVTSDPSLGQSAETLDTVPYRRVRPPSIILLPNAVTIKAGDRVLLLARPTGGEAILFNVDWALGEAHLGTIEVAKRKGDGSFEAFFTAAPAAEGTAHVTARIHEVPSVSAVAIIRITHGD